MKEILEVSLILVVSIAATTGVYVVFNTGGVPEEPEWSIPVAILSEDIYLVAWGDSLRGQVFNITVAQMFTQVQLSVRLDEPSSCCVFGLANSCDIFFVPDRSDFLICSLGDLDFGLDSGNHTSIWIKVAPGKYIVFVEFGGTLSGKVTMLARGPNLFYNDRET